MNDFDDANSHVFDPKGPSYKEWRRARKRADPGWRLRRAEQARFLHLLADWWESGELDGMEWCEAWERKLEPHPHYSTTVYLLPRDEHYWETDEMRAARDERHFGRDRKSSKTGATRTREHWKHEAGPYLNDHPLCKAAGDVECLVREMRSSWIRKREKAEQQRRLAQLVQDWIGPRDKRPTRKVAAAKYGMSESKCRQLVAEWRKSNPCGPQGERRRRGVGR